MPNQRRTAQSLKGGKRMIYIANIVGLVIALIAITFLMIMLIRAERKLAKHGESWMFENKTKK